VEAALLVLDDTHNDRLIPLPETIFLIGRDPQCHLRPHCELVSKLHCAVAAWAGRVRVRDLRSRNGTFLNGRPIRGEAVARDGDELRVGTLRFAFRLWAASGGSPAAPVSKHNLQWLLDSPPDDSVLSPGRQTHVRADAAAPAAEPAPGNKRRSKVVSAGRYLHDYFEQRRS
jgi:pSer/pThr/pTyr-binding forkhead associated (FHA) protein